MPETDKFKVNEYKIYLLAVCIFPNFNSPTFYNSEIFSFCLSFIFSNIPEHIRTVKTAIFIITKRVKDYQTLYYVFNFGK